MTTNRRAFLAKLLIAPAVLSAPKAQPYLGPVYVAGLDLAKWRDALAIAMVRTHDTADEPSAGKLGTFTTRLESFSGDVRG